MKARVKQIALPMVVSSRETAWFPGSTASNPNAVKVERPKPFSGKKPSKQVTGYDKQFWDIHRDGITQSTISLWRTCPMKMNYRMRQGLQGGTWNPALDFGSLFHHILDKVYSAKIGSMKQYDWETICTDCLDEEYNKVIDELEMEKDIQEFEKLHGLCSLVLAEYFKYWQKEDSKLQIVSIEEEFCFPYTLRNGVQIPIRGKLDGLIRIGGSYWLLEHKTKRTIEKNGRYSSEALVEKMNYERQIALYSQAVKYKYGQYPKGVLYNLIKRPGQEFSGSFNRKPETLNQYFARVKEDIDKKTEKRTNTSAYFLRHEIPLVKDELETWYLRDFDYIVEQIYDWATNNLASYRESTSCELFRKPCEFLGLCSGELTAEDFDVREEVFPELSENLEIE